MPILRNHSCGHLQRICPRCLSVGCDNTNCPECIGNNSNMVCKVCGCNDVVSMENYQYTKSARAKEQVDRIEETERRIKSMETTRPIQYRGGSGGGGIGVNIFSIFSIRNIVIVLVCFGLSNFMNFKDYDGVASVVIGLINILGAIPVIIYNILLHFVP